MHEFGEMFPPSCTSSSDFSGSPPGISNTLSLPEFFPVTVSPPTPLLPGCEAVRNENDSIREVLAEALRSEIGCSSFVPPGSGSAPVPSYYFSQRHSLIQRCLSSHTLLNDAQNPNFLSFHHQSGAQNLDLDTLPMSLRKVFSTGDLQMINMAQRQQEDSSVEGVNKVRCYSAEERKQRIERYRSKRSQRNFNKKIKYACRKTLADSRPRIRGRFARNEEIGESFQTEWTQMVGEEDEEDDYIWTKFLNALSTNLVPIDP